MFPLKKSNCIRVCVCVCVCVCVRVHACVWTHTGTCNCSDVPFSGQHSKCIFLGPHHRALPPSQSPAPITDRGPSHHPLLHSSIAGALPLHELHHWILQPPAPLPAGRFISIYFLIKPFTPTLCAPSRS